MEGNNLLQASLDIVIATSPARHDGAASVEKSPCVLVISLSAAVTRRRIHSKISQLGPDKDRYTLEPEGSFSKGLKNQMMWSHH